MDESIRSESVLELGQKLANELGLEPGDTLGRWMAHFIAEKLKQIQTANPRDRDNRLSECCDEILRLWSHRRSFPGRRPLENFEPVFRALESLDPNRVDIPRYFYPPVEEDKDESEETREWLDRASDVEVAARAVMRFCMSNAAEASMQQEREWVRLARQSLAMTGDDARVIADLLDYFPTTNRKSAEEVANEQAEELVRQLDLLSLTAQSLISQVRKQTGEATSKPAEIDV